MFPSLDKAWEYMLGIPNSLQQLEIAKDIAHQQILVAEKIGCEYKNMARLLKRDLKSVGKAKNTMINLVGCLQTVVTALKKSIGKRASTLLAIS